MRLAAIFLASMLGAGAAGANCVAVDDIAGAAVIDDRTVELHLRDGSAWQMKLEGACPALGYYEGFYYRRQRAGFLCEGKDSVIPRSGGDCPIDKLSRITKPTRR